MVVELCVADQCAGAGVECCHKAVKRCQHVAGCFAPWLQLHAAGLKVAGQLPADAGQQLSSLSKAAGLRMRAGCSSLQAPLKELPPRNLHVLLQREGAWEGGRHRVVLQRALHPSCCLFQGASRPELCWAGKNTLRAVLTSSC